jgi:Icc-related predicted phosphoesterase
VTSLQNCAFGVGADEDRERIYSLIPGDADIVITHTPPHGILDKPSPDSEHLGCRPLLSAVVCRVQPTLHVFGHVHGAYGTTTLANTFFVNASLAGPDYNLKNSPVVVDIVLPEAA